MPAQGWFARVRSLANLREIAFQLRRIANALEEQNLSRNPAARGTSFHSLYEDKNSPEDAALHYPTDEFFAELERREEAKRAQMGPEAELTDEEVEDLIPS